LPTGRGCHREVLGTAYCLGGCVLGASPHPVRTAQGGCSSRGRRVLQGCISSTALVSEEVLHADLPEEDRGDTPRTRRHSARLTCPSRVSMQSLPLNLLQSRGGSLHLPLFQNGACPCPSTPLLSVLMLVTHTMREIVPILPRLRIVAVSMQRLQVRACIAAIAVAMIDFNPIVVVKEQPTVGTAPTLLFEQHRQSRTDPWVPSLSRAPRDPIPIIGTAIAPDFDMPGDGDLTMGLEVPGMRSSRRRGKGEAGAPPVPISLYHPRRGCGRVTSVCPTTELGPGEGVEPGRDGLAHTGTVVVCPAPDGGIELTDHFALGQGPGAAHDPSELREMRLDVGLARFDQGCIPEALAARTFARLVFSHPVLADVKPQKLKPRVFSFEGVTDVAFGLMQCQADLCEPQAQKLLTMLKDATVLMEDHAVIRIRNDTGLRVDPGDGLVHAMQGYQGQQGGKSSPLAASLRR